jgi:uncharacterized iron-regulated membrane protein
MFRKVLFNIHWFVGITIGCVLAIMGSTGALMVFEDEILSVLNGRPGHVQVTGQAMSPEEILAKVRAAKPDKSVANLVMSSDPEQAVKVEFVQSGMGMPGGPRGDDGSVYFNQYTGEMKSAALPIGSAFMDKVEGLHRRLTLSQGGGGPMPDGPGGQMPGAQPPSGAPDRMPGQAAGQMPGAPGAQLDQQTSPPSGPGGGPQGMEGGPGGPGGERPFSLGEQLTSYAVTLLLLMALTGLYLRWPRRNASKISSWLKINFKLKGYAFNFNLHAVAGTVVFLGYLMSAHSGLMMSEMDWYKRTINSVAGMSERGPGGNGMRLRNARVNDNVYPLNTLWAAFEKAIPKYDTATLQFGSSNAQEFKISYLLDKAITKQGGRNVNSLVLDASSGAIKSHELFSSKSTASKLVERNFDLHSGAFFGTPGRVFIMFTSLMMPVLLVTGWMQYLARRKQKKQRAAALKAAAATAT